ncbi:acetate uptake transporter [Amycolatopsis sp. NPDC023774]|uniref:acetate uptake transporter n=1 Tax=Amycolatopsis sp. NPDC023774 TaxID=3155015 RepID=UPI0033DA63C3
MVHTEKGATVEATAARQEDPGAHIADPAPLGLAAFAMTTFVLSVFNAGLIKNTSLEAVVLPLALFYGGLTQFLAGMWEFRKGNTFGALAFSSFAAFWMSFAAYVKFVEPSLGTSAATATGLFLLAWTIFTAYLTVAAARVNGAVLAVLVFLTLTFLFLTIAELAAAPVMGQVGGWLGLVTAVLAWYASFAGVTNFTWKRAVLPLFPLSPARHH